MKFIMLGLIILICVSYPVGASLGVKGVKIVMDVSPGQTYEYPMEVSIGPSDSATDVTIDVMGFGQSADGSYRALDPASDLSPYTARPFVTVPDQTVHLNPGERRAFSATIQIPADVGEGGRYATIYIRPAPPQGGGSGATITTAYLIPVALTVKGPTLTHTGSITNLVSGEAVTGKPVIIQTTLKNTGNHHYSGIFVNVTVTDSGGKVVATASTKPAQDSLMPENEFTLTTPISAALAPGTHTVTSDAKVGTTLLDTKTVSFTIGGTPAPTPTVSEAPTQVATEAPTQAVSEVPTAPMTVVTTEESPGTPGTIATRAPLGFMTIMLALAAVSGILVLRRKG